MKISDLFGTKIGVVVSFIVSAMPVFVYLLLFFWLKNVSFIFYTIVMIATMFFSALYVLFYIMFRDHTMAQHTLSSKIDIPITVKIFDSSGIITTKNWMVIRDNVELTKFYVVSKNRIFSINFDGYAASKSLNVKELNNKTLLLNGITIKKNSFYFKVIDNNVYFKSNKKNHMRSVRINRQTIRIMASKINKL